MGNRFLKKINMPIKPAFILLALYLIFTNGLTSLLLFVSVLGLHEGAHFLVAKKLGYRLESFSIAAYGASLNYKEKILDSKDEFLISLAGPVCNIVCATIVVALWWAFPTFYNISATFAKQSYIFGLLNLLPCYPLDGGRVAAAILQNVISRERAIKLITTFNIVLSAIFFLFFAISCFVNFNPTFALIGSFLILSLISNDDNKYVYANRLNKKIKNFAKVKFIYVKKSTSLAKLISKIDFNRYIIFVVNIDDKNIFLDEGKLFKLSLNFPLTLSIGDVLNQIRHKSV